MRVHLVNATYELFRAFFAVPSKIAPDGTEVAAVRGLLSTLIYLTGAEGATHVGCATDHVIRSFRNDLYPGYKTDEGVAPELLRQFPIAEEGMRALGLVVWPMVEFEADDALATGAARYRDAEQVLLATPDKDLAQCVSGQAVVMLNRKDKKVIDEAGVREKWGVGPGSMADWLALVGDSADGYPGLPGFGARTASTLLAVYQNVEKSRMRAWSVKVRGAEGLAATLAARREELALYKRLATLRTDAPLTESLEDLRWQGARPELRDFCARLGIGDLVERVARWQ